VQVSLPRISGVDLPSHKDFSWGITPEDMRNYDRVFEHFKGNLTGSLSDSDMQKVFEMTKSPKDICRQVWELANADGSDTFTKPMFLVAMHLLYLKKKNEALQIPSTLPEELLASAGYPRSNPENQAPHLSQSDNPT
jgi:hypothetical protein